MEVSIVTELGIGDHVMNRRTGRRGVVTAVDDKHGAVRVKADSSSGKKIETVWKADRLRLLAYR